MRLLSFRHPLRALTHFLKKIRGHPLQILGVHLVERAEILAVDVEDGHDATFPENGDDDLGPRGAVAGDVSRKLFDVGHDDGLPRRPGGPANAPSALDAGAGDGPLERAEDELGLAAVCGFHFVEADPEEVERFLEDGGRVGQVGRAVGFVCRDGRDLGQYFFIPSGFVGGCEGECFCHDVGMFVCVDGGFWGC